MKKYTVIFYTAFLSCSSTAQNGNKQLQQIDAALSASQTTISKVLSDENFMKLHPLTEFRDIIKKHAKAEKTTMATANEPGKKITVKGTVKMKNGEAVTDALVYVYQTSDKGWYSADEPHVGGNEGDMGHARLFAYLKTDSNGGFEFETIQPHGYPNSDLPAHIHIMMWKDGKYISGMPGELLFDDDERLTPERRKSALADGYLIEKNSGTAESPVYSYTLRSGN